MDPVSPEISLSVRFPFTSRNKKRRAGACPAAKVLLEESSMEFERIDIAKDRTMRRIFRIFTLSHLRFVVRDRRHLRATTVANRNACPVMVRLL